MTDAEYQKYREAITMQMKLAAVMYEGTSFMRLTHISMCRQLHPDQDPERVQVPKSVTFTYLASFVLSFAETSPNERGQAFSSVKEAMEQYDIPAEEVDAPLVDLVLSYPIKFYSSILSDQTPPVDISAVHNIDMHAFLYQAEKTSSNIWIALQNLPLLELEEDLPAERYDLEPVE